MNRIYLILLLLLSQAIAKAQNDSIPPDINCPIADTVTLGPGGDCSFQYFYTVISSDNEPGDTLVQLSGLESGANFPIGNTVNLFQAIDAAGNTATCSFQLTVQNYAGPLTCKNNITVSLDSTCAWTPNASDLLDGNAGCTDSSYYVLEVDKAAPYGDGPWLPAEFGLSDIGQTYVFRVSDTIFGYNCTGNIQINDQLPPTLTCQDITISCAVNNVSPFFLRDSLGIPVAVPLATDGCSQVLLTHIDSTVDSACTSSFVGAINRTWTAQDDFGNSSTCMQQILLTRPVISDLQYPPDITVGCDADISSAGTGQPYLEFAGRKWTNTCSLGTAYSDSTIQTCPGSSLIIRRWFVIDWCNGDALEKVQNIKIQDSIGPFFLNCPDSTQTIGDTSSTNDPALWNAPHWASPPSGMENLCEGPVDLAIIASDNCSGINPGIRYLLFLDLDDNGTQETVVDSDNPPAAGTVNFGNAANPNYSGGEPRSFDERPVDSTLLYRFALQTTVSGDTITSRVVWNTDSIPAQYALLQLPHGTHKIRWTTQDSCGNEGTCEYEFIVKDVTPPTVVCADTALVLNIFPPGTSYLALSFLSPGATDNCAPFDSLRFGIRKGGAGTGFPSDTSVVFDCIDWLTAGLTIEIWAQDPEGNASFCDMDITLNDPSAICDLTGLLNVGGDIRTETGVAVANVEVTLAVTPPASTGFELQTQTDQDGHYAFFDVPGYDADYTLTPYKNTNHLDGVSTFDLVLISKHILGLESLDSPYKMIAADANHSNFITTFDIVELRKLILGIYDSLPDNTSWRFVDADYVFPDPANPFQAPFPESIHGNGSVSQPEHDFTGIKTGDVNGTALGDSLTAPTDDRERETLFFNVKNRDVEAGQAFTVHFTAAEKVLGYQFTLNTSDLEVLEILPGIGMTTANFAVFPGAVTTSVDVPATSVAESGAFAITFRSRKTGQLSDMLSISSRITKAEAYQLTTYDLRPKTGANGEPAVAPACQDPAGRKALAGEMTNDVMTNDVALRFDDGAISQPGFTLHQNQPNPVKDNTLIGFVLPENAEATLSIMDDTGRILYTQSGPYPGGYNEIVLEKALFDHTGVLFYKLETATDCAVRKMVLMK
jgi:hypothetical protein